MISRPAGKANWFNVIPVSTAAEAARGIRSRGIRGNDPPCTRFLAGFWETLFLSTAPSRRGRPAKQVAGTDPTNYPKRDAATDDLESMTEPLARAAQQPSSGRDLATRLPLDSFQTVSGLLLALAALGILGILRYRYGCTCNSVARPAKSLRL